MPVTKFDFKPIQLEILATWPECYARKRNGFGKNSYKIFLPYINKHQNTKFQKIVTYKTLLESKLIPPLEKFYHLDDPVPKIMEYLIINDARFVDEEFNAGQLRLIDKNDNFTIFNKLPMFTSFGQRNLGHCLLVCNLGAVTAHPIGHKMLLSSIYPPVYNPYGVYSVRFYYQNKEIYIILDDYIPFHMNYSGMIDSKECWYFLIEKALCKLNVYSQVGHYFKDVHLNYKYLNGAGTNVHKYFYLEKKDFQKYNNNKEEFWNNIKINLREHKTPYVVGFANHAYLIIDAFEYNGIKLVRWHNPVNYVVNYKGPFSWDNNEDWNKIPKTIQINEMENERFMNGKIHTTYWTTFEEYLKRGINITYNLQSIYMENS